MSTEGPTPDKERVTQLLASLTPDQRLVLGVIHDLCLPVSEADLAAAVGRQSRGTYQDLSAESVHCRLRHLALPKLADAGLISWDAGEASVTDITCGFIDEIGLIPGFDTERKSTPERVIHDDFRLAVLKHLEREQGTQDLTTLARRLCRHTAERTPTPEHVRQLKASLYHIHLPRLEDEGLVEVAREDGTIRCRSAKAPGTVK